MMQVEGFDVLEELGGARCCVHRAVQHRTGRVVVLKQAGWDRADVAAGLGREAHVLGRVTHPSLIRLLDVIDDEAGRTLVLAHAPGGDLASRLDQDGPMTAADAADLGARLAGALAALHREGIVHRDVHPGNVLIDAELVPTLADLDQALDPDHGALGIDAEIVGSTNHMDPRLLQGAPAGARTDLYGLGSTVWAAASGNTPRFVPGCPLPTHPPLPAQLRATIAACLAGEIGDAAAAAIALQAAALDAIGWQAPRGVNASHTTTVAPPDLVPLPAQTTVPPSPAQPTPLRVTALAGGGAGGSRPTTRRWGPAPPPRRAGAVDPVTRSGWLLLALTVLALPIVLLLMLTTRSTPAVPEAVAALPACDGVTFGAQDVPADVGGVGCSVPLRLEDGLLTLPTGTYAIGEDGDVLIAGDWTGDGRWTPGLYRPRTGDVFLFDSVPDGDTLTSRPAVRAAAGGRPTVIAGEAGHVVQVVDADS
jgi:hypothetical protein